MTHARCMTRSPHRIWLARGLSIRADADDWDLQMTSVFNHRSVYSIHILHDEYLTLSSTSYLEQLLQM